MTGPRPIVGPVAAWLARRVECLLSVADWRLR